MEYLLEIHQVVAVAVAVVLKSHTVYAIGMIWEVYPREVDLAMVQNVD